MILEVELSDILKHTDFFTEKERHQILDDHMELLKFMVPKSKQALLSMTSEEKLHSLSKFPLESLEGKTLISKFISDPDLLVKLLKSASFDHESWSLLQMV